MHNQPLQHVDVALGANTAVDTRMNGQAYKKSGIDLFAKYRGINTAGRQPFGLGLGRHIQTSRLILEPGDGFMPLRHRSPKTVG